MDSGGGGGFSGKMCGPPCLTLVILLARCACRNVGATVCCPGPLATGLDGKTRIVYGSSGLISQASGGRPGLHV